MTARSRVLLAGGIFYAIIVVVLRLNHMGDVVHEIALSERWLRGEPLYGVTPDQGSLWPPFATIAMAPFALIARLSLPVAAATWSVFGVACLIAALMIAQRWGWTPVLLALLATAMPVQTNFEHRNVNTVLLLLVIAGAAALEDGHERRAGAWFGLAAALKAFPALLIVYLAMRRSWRASAAGALVAVVATLLPLVPYGPDGAVDALGTWLSVGMNQEQWQLARSDQSLRSLVTRLGLPAWVAVVAVLLLLGGLAYHVTVRRRRAALPGTGAAALIAVLAAPVAWVHYFVLSFPAWVALLAAREGPSTASAAEGGVPADASRAGLTRAALWIAAIATSGWLTAGQGALRRAIHDANLYTWGALLVLLLLALQARRSSPETG